MGQWNIFGLLGVLFLMRGGRNIDVIDDSSRSGCKSYIFGGYRILFTGGKRAYKDLKRIFVFIYTYESQ